MKNYKNLESVAHAYANNLSDNGKASNLFFEYDTIYSYGYHFPIARKCENGILFTSRTYSNSTSKQVSIVRRSLHEKVIYCHNPTETPYKNLEIFIRDANNSISNISKARKPEKYLNALKQVQNEAEIYINFLNLRKSKEKGIKALLKELDSICNIENLEKYKKLDAKRIEAQRKAMLKAQKENAKIEKEDLNKFRSFEINYVRIGEYSFLRYNKEKNIIETSQRVDIELNEARLILKLIASHLKNSMHSSFGTIDLKSGSFPVKEINKNHIRIGCHLIKMEEIKRVCKEANI